LEQDHELIIYRSIGLDCLTLAKPALYVASIVVILLFIINLYLIPLSSRHFKDLEYSMKEVVSLSLIKAKCFNVVGDYTIYVESVGNGGIVENLILYANMRLVSPVLYVAKKGQLSRYADGLRIHLLNGSRQQTDKRTGKPLILYFEQYSINLESRKKNANERSRRPYELFLSELFTANEKISPKYARQMIVEGHKRLLSPVLAIVFVLIGLVFLLFKDYTRRYRYNAIVLASVSCVMLQVIVLALFNMADTIMCFIYINYCLVLLLGVFCFLTIAKDRISCLRITM